MSYRRLYLTEPGLLQASVVVRTAEVQGDSLHVKLDDLIHYPGGGGQYADRGAIVDEAGRSWQIEEVSKYKGDVSLVLDSGAKDSLAKGSAALAVVDPEYRRKQTTCHTASHVVMACVYDATEGKYEMVEVGNTKDGEQVTYHLRFDNGQPDWDQIVDKANELIRKDLVVAVEEYSSLEAARDARPDMFRVNPSLVFRPGKVRMVYIDGVDFNPCGGTHLPSTGSIKQVAFGGLVGDIATIHVS